MTRAEDFRGLGYVQALGLWVKDLGFRVVDLGFKVLWY